MNKIKTCEIRDIKFSGYVTVLSTENFDEIITIIM